MDLFGRLERALEGMVEGVFSRAFRTQLQPIEVAKRLTREMEDHRTISVSATYVPNQYTVHLGPETYTAFQAISERLLAELETYLGDYAAEHGYQTIGPMAVHLQEDAGVKSGELAVTTANASGSPAHGADPVSPIPPSAESDGLDATTLLSGGQAVALQVIAGEGVGRTIPLADSLTIGRGPSNTLSLAEPGVSRRHAQIVRESCAWVIRDLGSTNGTHVNGRRVTTHLLRVGDHIRIGNTLITVTG